MLALTYWLAKPIQMLKMLNQANQTGMTQNNSHLYACVRLCALAINRESKQDKHFVYASFEIAKPKFVCVCTLALC